jgi:hypothetical protein
MDYELSSLVIKGPISFPILLNADAFVIIPAGMHHIEADARVEALIL